MVTAIVPVFVATVTIAAVGALALRMEDGIKQEIATNREAIEQNGKAIESVRVHIKDFAEAVHGLHRFDAKRSDLTADEVREIKSLRGRVLEVMKVTNNPPVDAGPASNLITNVDHPEREVFSHEVSKIAGLSDFYATAVPYGADPKDQANAREVHGVINFDGDIARDCRYELRPEGSRTVVWGKCPPSTVAVAAFSDVAFSQAKVGGNWIEDVVPVGSESSSHGADSIIPAVDGLRGARSQAWSVSGELTQRETQAEHAVDGVVRIGEDGCRYDLSVEPPGIGVVGDCLVTDLDMPGLVKPERSHVNDFRR